MQNVLLHRGVRRSIEASAEASAICEKKMAEEIASLKAQLAAKEQEKISCVETVYKMESSLITVSKRLETRVEELERVKKDLEKSEKERSYLEKKLDEKDAFFFRSANRLWELSRDCLDKFGMKPEAACWEEGDFSSFFSWLCRQYDDLPMMLQTTADLSCMYSTRALFHLMREANDPLYAKLLDEGYKFPPVESLSKVSTRTHELGKKYFYQYWNSGGRELVFAKAKARVQKVSFLGFCFLFSFFFVVIIYYILSSYSSLKRSWLLCRRKRRQLRKLLLKERRLPIMFVTIPFSCWGVRRSRLL